MWRVCVCVCVYRCARVHTRVRTYKGVCGCQEAGCAAAPVPLSAATSSRFRVSAKLTESGAAQGGVGAGGAVPSRSHWFGDNYF